MTTIDAPVPDVVGASGAHAVGGSASESAASLVGGSSTGSHSLGVAGGGAAVRVHDPVGAGVAGWLTGTDSKRTGRMFICTGLVAFLAVAVMSVLLGIDRSSPGRHVVEAGAVPQLFAATRLVLVFGALLPVMLGLAMAVVPLQVGARALAFPRLAATGFWTWVVGVLVATGAIAGNGGPGGGNRRMVALFMTGHVVLLLGLVAAALAVAATVMTSRAPGMNMRRVPLFSFAALVGALGVLAVLPVLIGTLLFTYVDYRYGGSGFGSSSELFSWIGYGSSQPATFVYALPALGILAETAALAGRARTPRRGTVFVGFGLVGLAALGGVIQVPAAVRRNIRHVSFSAAAGDIVPYAAFNLLPVLGVLVVLGIVALGARSHRPRVLAPFVFAALGVIMVLTGMLGHAVFLIGDARLGGTVFEEGVRVYVAEGALLAAMGGVLLWAPKLWGRQLSDKAVLPLALLGFIGIVLASLPYYVAGFAKQPADSVAFDYGGPERLWNVLVTAGHVLVALTVLAFLALLARTMRSTTGDHPGDDPWDGQTLEWATSSPAPYDNFTEIHSIGSAEPLLDLKSPAPSVAAGRAVSARGTA